MKKNFINKQYIILGNRKADIQLRIYDIRHDRSKNHLSNQDSAPPHISINHSLYDRFLNRKSHLGILRHFINRIIIRFII